MNHYEIDANVYTTLTSGVAATRFSRGKVSFGIPIVSLLYGIPFGVVSSAEEEADELLNPRLQCWYCCKERVAVEDLVVVLNARRIMFLIVN